MGGWVKSFQISLSGVSHPNWPGFPLDWIDLNRWRPLPLNGRSAMRNAYNSKYTFFPPKIIICWVFEQDNTVQSNEGWDMSDKSEGRKFGVMEWISDISSYPTAPSFTLWLTHPLLLGISHSKNFLFILTMDSIGKHTPILVHMLESSPVHRYAYQANYQRAIHLLFEL